MGKGNRREGTQAKGENCLERRTSFDSKSRSEGRRTTDCPKENRKGKQSAEVGTVRVYTVGRREGKLDAYFK